MQAPSNTAITAGTIDTAILVISAAISRLLITVGVVAAAIAVAFVVVEQGQRAQVSVPAVGESDAIAVVFLLVVARRAFHAVVLTETVLAVGKVLARLAGVVSAMISAQTAVGVAATKLSTALIFEAGAAAVVSVLGVTTAVADVSKTLTGDQAASLIDVERVAISAQRAGISIAARVAVVHAGNAFAVSTGANVVAGFADLALRAALASGAVASAVAIGNAGTIDNLETTLASVALGGAALKAVGGAGVASAGFRVQGETIHALVARASRALFAVCVVASSASAGRDVAVVTVHARLANGAGHNFAIDNRDAFTAGRATVNVTLGASAGVEVQVVSVHALVALGGGVTVFTVQAAIDSAGGASCVSITVDTSVSGVTVDHLVLNALRVNTAAFAVTLIIIQQAHVAHVQVPAFGKSNACPPRVTVGLVVSNVAGSAETLSEAIRTVVKVGADVVVVQGADSVGSSAKSSGITAAVLGIVFVARASATIVGGAAAVADVGNDLLSGGAGARDVIECESIFANVAGLGVGAAGAVGGAGSAAGGVPVVEQHHRVSVDASFALVVFFADVAVVAAVLSNQTTGTIKFRLVQVVALKAATNVPVRVNGGALGTVVIACCTAAVLSAVVALCTGIAGLVSGGINNTLATTCDGAGNTSLDLADASRSSGSWCCASARGSIKGRRQGGSVNRHQIITRLALLALVGVVVADTAVRHLARLAGTIAALAVRGTEALVARLAHVSLEASDAVLHLAKRSGDHTKAVGGVVRVQNWEVGDSLLGHRHGHAAGGKHSEKLHLDKGKQ